MKNHTLLVSLFSLLLSTAVGCAPRLNYAPTVPPVERIEKGGIQISGYGCEYGEVAVRGVVGLGNSPGDDNSGRVHGRNDESGTIVVGGGILVKPNSTVTPGRDGRRQTELEGTVGIQETFGNLLFVSGTAGLAGGSLHTFYPDSAGESQIGFSYMRPSVSGALGLSLASSGFPLGLEFGGLTRFSLPFMFNNTGPVEPRQRSTFLMEIGAFTRIMFFDVVAFEVMVSGTVDLFGFSGTSTNEWRYDVIAIGARLMLH